MEYESYYIYCDESCHLPNDDSNVMVLGALYFPKNHKRKISQDIRAIKNKHGLDSRIEIKWTKISDSKKELFVDLVNYFFNNDYLFFRAVVAKGKSKLNHSAYNNNDWQLWYYKMYFLLLDKICNPGNNYRIFIDTKDSRGGARIKKLHEVLCNNKYDFKNEIISEINQVSSDRTDFLQLTDIFTGVLSFYHRGFYNKPDHSKAKSIIVRSVIDRIGCNNINHGTYLSESKFNIFIWTPNGVS